MTVYIGIDDTDVIGSRGTGRFAREIAGELGKSCTISAVTRHQLLVHPDIPYTSHNSCAVIHVEDPKKTPAREIFTRVKDLMAADFIEGSDPGLAVADRQQVTSGLLAYAKDAQKSVLDQDRAYALAKNSGILLEGLGGTNGGVIGALAGIGLASTGNDGRFLQKGTIRDVTGPSSCERIRAAGVDEIVSTTGLVLKDETIEIEKNVKPCCIGGRAVVLVEERDGGFYALKRD